MGALQGRTASSPAADRAWIPVGVNDITSSASNGIRALSLSDDFREKLCKPWANSVVIRLLGKNVGYAYLCHRLHAIWKPVGNLHIVDLDNKCFLIKFSNDQDYFKALTGGPWMILEHYLVVQQWDKSFRVTNELPKKMVVWVRFPHLPIHFYHAQVLTSLGNLIGKTVKIDFSTQRAERGKFARIAIEIDLSVPLPPMVLLDGAPQLVEYENIPTLCFGCGRIGHDSQACPLSKPAQERRLLEPDARAAATVAPSPPVAPPEQYGPWMVISRRQNRSKKATLPHKERGDLQRDLTADSVGKMVSNMESGNQRTVPVIDPKIDLVA
ncbi:hypothetical protein LINPERHAP1_LOCUS21567 [Linum perenne]